jgi:hypothetical protein
MREYKPVLPIWGLYPWIPLNIYIVSVLFSATSGSRNIGFALPVIFVIGFVGSALTYVLLDILIWFIFVKPNIIKKDPFKLTPQQRLDYQYEGEVSAQKSIQEKVANQSYGYDPERNQVNQNGYKVSRGFKNVLIFVLMFFLVIYFFYFLYLNPTLLELVL